MHLSNHLLTLIWQKFRRIGYPAKNKCTRLSLLTCFTITVTPPKTPQLMLTCFTITVTPPKTPQLMLIFIIKDFRTIFFIFIVISTTFPCVQQDTWRNCYRRWFPKVLRRQSSRGCRFKRVTIQEYLTLVPGYG